MASNVHTVQAYHQAAHNSPNPHTHQTLAAEHQAAKSYRNIAHWAKIAFLDAITVPLDPLGTLTPSACGRQPSHLQPHSPGEVSADCGHVMTLSSTQLLLTERLVFNGGKVIDYQSKYRYLKLNPDMKLNCIGNIKEVIKKVNHTIWILMNMGNYLTPNMVNKIHEEIIVQCFDYGEYLHKEQPKYVG